MNSTTTKPNWIDAWLETQQGWLGRWQATAVEQRVDAMRVGMETLRQQCNPANPSAEMLNVVQSFQSLLQACTAHAGQSQSASDAASANPFTQLMQEFPLGFTRERQLEWQAYLKASGDYQQAASRLVEQLVNVFTQSLQQVPEEIEKRKQAGQPVETIRELYDVSVDCGEQCFATIAKSEQFVLMQAAHTNALSYLRLAERALLERWMQQYDLPTRSELNSLHKKVHCMSERIAQLEAQLAEKTGTDRSS